MTQEPFAEMLANWKKVGDQFASTWGKGMASGVRSEEAQAAMREMEKAYLSLRTMMGQAAKGAYEPLVSAAGAVPLSEFQRLADQVHTILLRLDRIDDALAELRLARPRPHEPAPEPRPSDQEPPKRRKKKS